MLGFYLTPATHVSVTEKWWLVWTRTFPGGLVRFKCWDTTSRNRLGSPLIASYEYGVIDVGFLWLSWALSVWDKRFVLQNKSTSLVAQVWKDLVLSLLLTIKTVQASLSTLIHFIVDFHSTLDISDSILHSIKSVLLSEQFLNVTRVESFWNLECYCTGLLHSCRLMDLLGSCRWVEHMDAWSQVLSWSNSSRPWRLPILW